MDNIVQKRNSESRSGDFLFVVYHTEIWPDVCTFLDLSLEFFQYPSSDTVMPKSLSIDYFAKYRFSTNICRIKEKCELKRKGLELKAQV